MRTFPFSARNVVFFISFTSGSFVRSFISPPAFFPIYRGDEGKGKGSEENRNRRPPSSRTNPLRARVLDNEDNGSDRLNYETDDGAWRWLRDAVGRPAGRVSLLTLAPSTVVYCLRPSQSPGDIKSRTDTGSSCFGFICSLPSGALWVADTLGFALRSQLINFVLCVYVCVCVCVYLAHQPRIPPVCLFDHSISATSSSWSGCPVRQTN